MCVCKRMRRVRVYEQLCIYRHVSTQPASQWPQSSSSSPRYTVRYIPPSVWHTQLTPTRVGIARSAPVQLGASTHVIWWDIVRLSPQSHTSLRESFQIFIMAALSADLNSSKWTRAHLWRWPSVHLGWSLCHATQLIDYQGRSPPLPTM